MNNSGKKIDKKELYRKIMGILENKIFLSNRFIEEKMDLSMLYINGRTYKLRSHQVMNHTILNFVPFI
jgi:hypothetical protein